MGPWRKPGTLEACVPRRFSLFQGVAHDMNDSLEIVFSFQLPIETFQLKPGLVYAICVVKSNSSAAPVKAFGSQRGGVSLGYKLY
jgi:hypothetical protein